MDAIINTAMTLSTEQHVTEKSQSTVEHEVAYQVIDLLAPISREERARKKCYCGLLAIDDGLTCRVCHNLPPGVRPARRN